MWPRCAQCHGSVWERIKLSRNALKIWKIVPFFSFPTKSIELEGFVGFLISKILYWNPSLNTQSCIRGLLVAHDFCFWANTEKKGSWPIMSNLLKWFFHVFRGKIKKLKYFLKHCSIRTKKLHKMKLKTIWFFS